MTGVDWLFVLATLVVLFGALAACGLFADARRETRRRWERNIVDRRVPPRHGGRL